MTVCRCGHVMESEDPHPCHRRVYTCRKPATQRYYAQPGLGKYALTGMQLKMSVSSTWACDECWEDIKKEHEEFKKKHGLTG